MMHVQHLKLRAAITAAHEQEYVVFTAYFIRQNNNHNIVSITFPEMHICIRHKRIIALNEKRLLIISKTAFI